MQTARILWRGARIGLHLLLGLLLTPLVSRRDPVVGERRSNPYVVCWWYQRLLDIVHVEIQTTGPMPQAPALLVSNHISWLDIVVLGALTPTSFLSKFEVRQWPVIGWLATRCGTLFIRRGAGHAGDISIQIATRLRSNGLLTLFPEGTTTDGSDVRPFFSRLFAAAIDTHTRVVPVSLRYHIDGKPDLVAPYIDDQSLGQNLRGILGRPRTQVRVAFGPALATQDLSRRQIATLTRQTILDSLTGDSTDASRSGEARPNERRG